MPIYIESSDRPFIIPAQIKMGHKTLTVRLDEYLTFTENCIGKVNHRTNTIHIQKSTEAWPIPFENQVDSYFHEVLHIALERAEYNELNEDEDFVNRISGFLAQAALSSEGEAGK